MENYLHCSETKTIQQEGKTRVWLNELTGINSQQPAKGFVLLCHRGRLGPHPLFQKGSVGGADKREKPKEERPFLSPCGKGSDPGLVLQRRAFHMGTTLVENGL